MGFLAAGKRSPLLLLLLLETFFSPGYSVSGPKNKAVSRSPILTTIPSKKLDFHLGDLYDHLHQVWLKYVNMLLMHCIETRKK